MSLCIRPRIHVSVLNSKLTCCVVKNESKVSLHSASILANNYKRLLYTGSDEMKLWRRKVLNNTKTSAAHFTTTPRECKENLVTSENLKSNKKNGKNNEWETWIKKGVIFLSFVMGSGLLYKLLDKEKPTEGVDPTDRKKKKRGSRSVVMNPTSSDDIPKDVPFLLIGGGTASFSAFRAIKSIEPKAKVLVISNESYFPYMRPPLSKEMFYNDDRKLVENLEFKQWNGTERSLFYEPEDFYTPCSELMNSENGGVSVALGWSVKKIDVINKVAILDDDTPVKYNKCLLATGARPKKLQIFELADDSIKQKVSFYRGIKDFEELDEIIENGAYRIAIIGGGFLGSELACALSRRGSKRNLKIIQIFTEEGNMANVLPKYLSEWTTKKVKHEGVEVYNNSAVQKMELENNSVKLHLNEEKVVSVDHVIIAVGVEPNTDLAEPSKLECNKDIGGFVVNAELEARKDLFAAGDCACFYDIKLGRRRVEHHDHAVISGRLAGENMAGAGKPYLHQSMFWSDLGPDVGYEAIGIVDSSLPTVGVFVKPHGYRNGKENQNEKYSVSDRNEEENKSEKLSVEQNEVPHQPISDDEYEKGVIFYLQNDTVVGIVLWNIFDKMSVARQVLKDERKYDLNEVAKLFNIHEQ